MEDNQENKHEFSDTRATQKIFELKKRIKAVCGGTSASKTISIIFWIIDYCQSNKNKKFDVMSESYPHLEDGAIKDFKAIMLDRGYWKDDCWNESKHFYKFETGTILKFMSIDKLGKAHGPRRDGLFMNEANNIPFNIYDQLEVRTKEHIWLDWNPTSEFWYYTEIKDKVDHDFLTLTYLDCKDVLDPQIVQSIESKKIRKGWWQVYGLGQLGEVEGKIYKDWKIIDELPHEARLERYGLNFGYSNHPLGLVAIYYHNGGYIIDEIAYGLGIKNRHIADTLKNYAKAPVIADSAEPKSIDEIMEYDIDIVGAEKGKGSVNHGISYVQDQRISITRRSINVIREYRNYLWKVDMSGIVTNIPEEPFHYIMDACRYGLVGLTPVDADDEKRRANELYVHQRETMANTQSDAGL